MNYTAFPSYTQINQSFEKHSIDLHPSEAHGLLCGLLCNPDLFNWESFLSMPEQSSKEIEGILHELYLISKKQLEDYEFGFHLLLPDDSKDLANRAKALTLWCQGFLTGLKKANIKITDRQPNETTEAIDDIIEISKMNYEDVVANEEDEGAYSELIEYIRMAVIFIYQELTNDKAMTKSNVTSTYSHH